MTVKLWIGIFCGLFAAFAVCASDQGLSAEQLTVQQALTNATLQSVEQVKVFYLPERITTIVALDGPRLEHACYGCISIKNFQYSKLRDRLLKHLKASSMTAKNDVPEDYRWGCVFMDARGKRLLSLYFTRGTAGCVNGVPVTTDGKFVDYLRQEFRYLTELW